MLLGLTAIYNPISSIKQLLVCLTQIIVDDKVKEFTCKQKTKISVTNQALQLENTSNNKPQTTNYKQHRYKSRFTIGKHFEQQTINNKPQTINVIYTTTFTILPFTKIIFLGAFPSSHF